MFLFDHIFQVCILEAVSSVTEELFELLVSKTYNQPSLYQLLKKMWKEHAQQQAQLLQSTEVLNLSQSQSVHHGHDAAQLTGVKLLKQVISDLDRLHPHADMFYKTRKKIREWTTSSELLLSQLDKRKEG